MMITKPANYFHISLRKTFRTIAILLNLIGVLHINASAIDNNPICYYKGGHTITLDTIKMTMGVPLNPEDISPLLIGEAIPMLILPSASGKSFDLNKAVTEKPTILVFYRGGWCPYCSKQLSGLQEIEKDLFDIGYQVIAISTDSPENLSKSMHKQELSYTLLSDADLSASKQFGIAFKSPKSYDSFLPEFSDGKNVDKLLPVPSVFIVNKKGNIVFEYINPNITQRISAALLKAAAISLLEEM